MIKLFRLFLVAVMFGSPVIEAAEESAWIPQPVPGAWDASGQAWYRCWVKVPDHWTVMTGRPLYRESVTFTVREVAEVHEVYLNGQRLGGAGSFPPQFARPTAGHHRYKVPPGTLLKGHWNEVAIRIFNQDGKGGFLGEAPSIQGYFLECHLAGQWGFRRGEENLTGKALATKPPSAAFDQFREASAILGEAAELMPGRRLPPEKSLELMQTEDDLAVEQLLAEPLVAQPTHLSFDERGRLWVSQYRQYPYPAGLKQISRDKYYRAKYDQQPKAPPHHNRGRSRITVHEDTDGDGSYDRHKVFLDGLDLANAALPDHDGVWVMHTPYLLFYPDKDRDDVPDADPEVHLAGFGFEDTHSIANGLVWGPDGWIYGGQGSTVASRIVRPGLDAEGAGVYFEGCMAWRYHPPSKRFEIFAEGGGNVFGLEFDGDGRLFSGHNGGDTRGWHYVQGGYLLKQGRTPSKFGPPANPYAFGDLAMMRSANPIARFTHATILCEGSAMPTRLQGCFLAADPIHHFLVLSARTRRGSTFETRDLGHPLECGDEGFRPVYLCNAPDGSVYVADFYEQYIAHGQHYQSQIDPSTGRVYRLRGKGKELEKDLDLAALETGALIALLNHPNKWHRQTAVRLLGKRREEPSLHGKLLEWIRVHDDRAALDGLWALALAGGLDEQIAAELLRHPYAPLRAWTVRLIGERAQRSEAEVAQVRELAKREADLEVWSQLASSAQRMAPAQGLPVVGELLRRSADLEDPNLPLMLWWAIETHSENREAVLQLFGDPLIWQQAMVRREILPRLMRRYAVTGRHDDLLVCARLLDLAPGDEERAHLMTGFEQAFEGGALPALPGELVEALRNSVNLSLNLRVRQGEETAIAEAVTLVADDKSEGSRRLRLIKTFGELALEKALPVLLENVGRGHDPAIRKAALSALQNYAAEEVGNTVVRRYRSLADEELPAAQALLSSRPEWSRTWLNAMDAGTLDGNGVSPEAVNNLRLHEDPQLASLVAKHFGEVAVQPPPTAARVQEVRQIIEQAPGNPYRGRPIFKQRCASCHVLFYSGGKIGPDLTSYQRDDLDTMLTSVVDPSAEIREGYEAQAVTTKDGRRLTGFLADQSEKAIVLRSFDGSDLPLAREDLAEMKPLGRSLMPEGLLAGLSDAEIRDLFAFLRISQPFLED